MSNLEREYRNALRRYPRGWRRQHEEALLGVLLDNAEAEGRHHMSQADRKDLAHNSTRLRVARVAPILLFIVGLAVLAHTASLLLNGVGLGSELLLHAPQLAPVPIGSTYVQPTVAMDSDVVYLVSAVLILATLGGGLLHQRRNRRADQVR